MPSSSLEVVGVVLCGPSTPVVAGPVAAPSLAKNANLGLKRTVAKHTGDSISVTGTFPIPMQGMTGVSFMFFRALSGVLQLRVTSSLGANQLIPLSGMVVWDNPQGPFVTAIDVIGTGDIEYTLAGS